MAGVTVPPFTEAPSTVVGSTPQIEFEFQFPFWDDADLIVSVDGTVLTASDYTVEGYFIQDGEAVEGGYGSGLVTLNTAVSNCTVVIDRNVTGTRETQFSRAGPVPPQVLNADLNRLTARQQDVERRVAAAQAIIEEGGGLIDSDGNAFNPNNGVQTFDTDDQGRVTEITSTQTGGVWVQTLTWTDGVDVPAVSMWVKQ